MTCVRRFRWPAALVAVLLPGAVTVTPVQAQLVGLYRFDDAAANLRQIYIDGQLRVSDNPGRAHVRSGDFRIGRTCSFCGLGEYFQGTLDDVAIFSQSLTPAEIMTIMSGDFSGFGVP